MSLNLFFILKHQHSSSKKLLLSWNIDAICLTNRFLNWTRPRCYSHGLNSSAALFQYCCWSLITKDMFVLFAFPDRFLNLNKNITNPWITKLSSWATARCGSHGINCPGALNGAVEVRVLDFTIVPLVTLAHATSPAGAIGEQITPLAAATQEVLAKKVSGWGAEERTHLPFRLSNYSIS